jgi:hypothetical protein
LVPLYLQRERECTLDLVRRAEGAGYEALVITVERSNQWSAQPGAPCPLSTAARSARRKPVALSIASSAGRYAADRVLHVYRSHVVRHCAAF